MAPVIKNQPADAGDVRDRSSFPGSGRSPGGEHGNPLQYSYLQNPMDRGAWQATIHRVSKSRTWLKRLSVPGLLSQCTPLLNYAHWVKLLSDDKTQFHPMVLLLPWSQKKLLMTEFQLHEDISLSSYQTSSCVKSTSLTHLGTSHSSPFLFP